MLFGRLWCAQNLMMPIALRATPLNVNVAAQTLIVFDDVAPQISGPPNPSAAPIPAYAARHRRHLGMNASSAAGRSQRSGLRQSLVCEGDIGGIIAVMMAHPFHTVFQLVLVPALGHEVE